MDLVATPCYAFGKNNYTQLGKDHDDPSIGHIEDHSTPLLLSFLGKKRIKRIACGYEHSIVVTECKEAWGFGRNDNAQLGIGSTNNMHNLPQKIDALCNKDITQLVCGAHFALVLCSNGTVMGLGSNGNGQLGLGHTQEQKQPVEVPLLSNKDVSILSCGGFYSMVATR
jgi:alpha-tubulin suppressor-like RCC1 family protein